MGINNISSSSESAYTKALLRSLQFSGVQFLRYVAVDPYNNLRAKVKPINHMLKQKNTITISLDQQVSIAEICLGGLPYHADVMIDGTGMDARNVLTIQPDPESLRILPYAPKTAIVLGNLKNQYTDEDSPFCTRSLLAKLVKEAAEQHNIAFNVGAELEFCLVAASSADAVSIKYVDQSVFANTTTLNDQQDFISTLYEHFERQYLPIELIHAESGPGQLEVVLEYTQSPVELCDHILLAKETIGAVAHQFGYKALFIPKYDMLKAGNGLHVHASIRDARTGSPLFCEGSALTAQGGAFVEGILQHLPAIMGLSLPTVNSYRRVGKGCWTGSVVGWAVEDKEVGVRVCSNLRTKEWDHVECKLFDSSANPYLALGALLHSGLNGIIQQAELRNSLHDQVDSESEDGLLPLPGSLSAALRSLEGDVLVTSFMGERLTKAYLALRRYEMERALKMTLDNEVQEALSRC